MELVYSDIMGPIWILLLNNSKYILIFIEHISQYLKYYFIYNKTTEIILDCFKEYKAWVENITGKYIKILQIDNRTKYINEDMRIYLKIYSIKH